MNGHHVGREREQIVTTNKESYKARRWGWGTTMRSFLQCKDRAWKKGLPAYLPLRIL